MGPEDRIPAMSSAGAEQRDGAHPGPKIDGYRFIKLIGEGTEGRVYLAVETLPNREVAVKVVKGIWATSEAAKARFFRQIGLASRLEHRHIARIYHCGTEPHYFFSMELVKGVPLSAYVRTANFDRRRTLRLFLEVCQAVSYAHRSLVVHLDLKPGNILVDEIGNPHVLDFGLAMALSEDGGWEYSKREGTPAYMSPEQARGCLALNNAVQSDIYSLGVILYTLLTGRFPRDTTGSKLDVIQRVAGEPIVPPDEANPQMPGELAAILCRALAADPRARYASAAEFAEDIGNYLQGNPIRAVPNTTLYVLRKWFWKHRYGLTWAAAILAVLMSIAAWSYVSIAHERTVAELRRADVLVSQGDLLGNAEKWELANESYSQARDIMEREDGSTTTADLGTYNAYRHAPPPLTVIQGEGGVMDVALTRDGRRAVTASHDGRVRVYDPLTGRQIGNAISAHDQMIFSVAVASGADLALTGSADSTATLIDLKTGQTVATLSVPNAWITRVALDSDGRRALTVARKDRANLVADEDDQLSIWSLPDGKLQSTFPARGQVVCAAFSPDDMMIATGGSELAFWDAATSKKLRASGGGRQIESLAFSADGKQLVTGGSESSVRLWDAASGRQVLGMRSGGSPVNAVAFSRDGQAVVSTGNDGVSQIWSRFTGAELARLLMYGQGAAANSAAAASASVLCADGDVEARVAGDDTLSFWNATAPAEVRRIESEDAAIHGIGSMFTGRIIFAATSNGLKVWDAPTGRPLDLPPLPIDSADAAAVAPDGSAMAVLSGDTLSILDTSSWKVSATGHMDRRPNSPAVLAFSPNGRMLITSGPKFGLSLRDARSLAEIGQLVGQTAPVMSAVFSPDSTQILSAGRDRVVRLWNAVTMQPIREMTDHLDAVNAVIFSPDGRFAYSAGGNSDIENGHNDFAMRRWDVNSGKCVARFTGGQARVRALALNHDGSILVSASDDNTLTLWQTSDGRELSTLIGHAAPVVAVSFAAETNSIQSADEDHMILIWDLSAPRRRNDPRASAGERFAFLGLDGWAADCLLADQAGGEKISHLTLARCFWNLGQTARAMTEMNTARDDGEAPADYLAFCLRTLGKTPK